MKMKLRLLFALLALSPISQANAITGDAQTGSPAERALIMLLKSDPRGSSFCTAVVIAPDVLITAAHCVKPPAQLLAFWPGGRLEDMPAARHVAIHPLYRADAPKTRERSIDLALVQLTEKLPARFVPITIDYAPQIAVGTPFTISGFGLATEKDAKTGGTLLSAALVTREPLSKLLIWAKGARNGATGGCTGDSGGPFLSQEGKLVGITVWSQGSGNRACGELTQALRLDAARDFIESTRATWAR